MPRRESSLHDLEYLVVATGHTAGVMNERRRSSDQGAYQTDLGQLLELLAGYENVTLHYVFDPDAGGGTTCWEFVNDREYVPHAGPTPRLYNDVLRRAPKEVRETGGVLVLGGSLSEEHARIIARHVIYDLSYVMLWEDEYTEAGETYHRAGDVLYVHRANMRAGTFDDDEVAAAHAKQRRRAGRR